MKVIAVTRWPSIGDTMATFITTIKFSQQGIKGIDETTKRAAALKAVAKEMGVKVKNIYWTLGDHDGVLIIKAPDAETATALLLHLGATGNVHTTTARAFTAEEMDKILTKVHRENT
jgi:uncharacterized protein with GYD domain